MKKETFKVIAIGLALLFIGIFSAKAENWDFSLRANNGFGTEVHGTFEEVSSVISWSSEATADKDFDAMCIALKNAKNGRLARDFDTIYEGAVFCSLLNMYGFPKNRLLNIAYTYKFGNNTVKHMNVICIWTAPDRARVAIFYNY